MKQVEKNYLISDAAKQVQVESHVLRYWEEELKLPIKRNEMGHRYYTEEDIVRFREIKELKEQGLQLKAIRNILQKGRLGDFRTEGKIGIAENNRKEEGIKRHVVMVNKGEFMPISEESKEAKSLRLQQLLQNMIMEAVRSNNKEVCEEIKEAMLKELDYQFRIQEEREDERDAVRFSRQEEHYRQIDELIRTRNKSRLKKEAKSNDEKENRMENVSLSEKELLSEDTREQKVQKEKKLFFKRKKRSII